ncbi:MAG TPA: hypothetical protein VG652_11995 [Gaiellaceae bacterium]|nr:hypothetical protein [Gaiellaceae bacterium]
MTKINQLFAGARPAGRFVVVGALRVGLPLIVLWLALGRALAAVTGRVTDWFVMTDELLYERLAISIARTGSPLPRVHGELIPSVNQLYPLIIAPVYRHGYVPSSLHDAHVLNAYVMTSAAIPAFLLARRVTGRCLPAFVIAAVSVTVPWIVFASFLLTEVAAYPAFLWAILAVQSATVRPRLRNDVLALAGLTLATLARTQLLILAVILPIAVVAQELAFADRADGQTLAARLRALAGRRRLLSLVYGIAAVLTLGLAATGSLSSSVGTYAQAVEGNPFPSGFVPSFAEHLSTIALALGIVPFVVGIGWLLASSFRTVTRELHAFAVIGSVTVLLLSVEVTSFDLRFGGGVVRDRYLFYIVPLVLVGLACAVYDERWPRRSLIIPAAVVAYGFWRSPLTTYPKLNLDTPVSMLNDELVRLGHSLNGARASLIVATVVLTVLFVQASFLLPRSWLAGLLTAIVCFALPAETVYAFVRLFRVDGTAGRPLTVQQGVVFDWVDRTLQTTKADVTALPFALDPADYYAGVGFWWDMEFWNATVDRAAYLPGEFYWTPSTFPKLILHFNQRTGLANSSPTHYATEADNETRFRISGRSLTDTRGVLLIQTAMPWRTDWLSSGLYDDGWSKPHVPTQIRIFAQPAQKGSVIRYLTLGVGAAPGIARQPFRVTSNRGTIRAFARAGDRVIEQIQACVPAHGFADVRLTTPVTAPIGYGDPRNALTSSMPRRGGVLFTEIAEADEIGPAC